MTDTLPYRPLYRLAVDHLTARGLPADPAELARLYDVPKQTVARWHARDTIDAYQADRIACRVFNRHPVTVWGLAGWTDGAPTDQLTIAELEATA